MANIKIEDEIQNRYEMEGRRVTWAKIDRDTSMFIRGIYNKEERCSTARYADIYDTIEYVNNLNVIHGVSI